MPRLPTPCPRCGELGRRPAGSVCQACHMAAIHAARPRCCDCGKEVRLGRERCVACWRALRRAEGTLGSGGQRVDTCACGRQKLARSARCIECAHIARAQWLRETNPTRAKRERPAPPAPVAPKAPAPQAKRVRAPTPSLDRVTRLARAIARDPRPDEEKINSRLTLLKMIKRRFDRKRGA